jgi:hypothetical protein
MYLQFLGDNYFNSLHLIIKCKYTKSLILYILIDFRNILYRLSIKTINRYNNNAIENRIIRVD